MYLKELNLEFNHLVNLFNVYTLTVNCIKNNGGVSMKSKEFNLKLGMLDVEIRINKHRHNSNNIRKQLYQDQYMRDLEEKRRKYLDNHML